MRYIEDQRHIASCGPVAISNAMKWAGISPNAYDIIHSVCGAYGYKLWCGMSHYWLTRVLKLVGLRFTKQCHPTVRDIERCLDNGGVCILGYRYWRWREAREHYIFIHGHTSKYLKISNGHFKTRGKKKLKIKENRKDVFRKLFEQSRRTSDYPGAWFIERD